MTRRRASRPSRLAAVALITVGAILVAGRLAHAPQDPLIERIESFRHAHNLPGGVLAYGRAGEAPHVVALGLADPVAKTPMSTDQVFYIASLSKPLTGATLLALEHEGRLTRHDLLGDYLGDSIRADPRLARVPLTALMSHTAGFDRTASFDPILDPQRLGLPSTATCAEIATAMLQAATLDTAPQTAQSYSNFGYCLLSQVIAIAGGETYPKAVRRAVGIAPLTIGDGSPRHWSNAGGTWRLLYRSAEARRFFARLGAAGGWQTTARAFWRFAARPHPAARTERPDGATGDDWYALGWRVWRSEDGVHLTHAGFLPGVFAFAAQFSNGMTVVALFNSGVRDGIDAFYALFESLCRVQGLACGAPAGRNGETGVRGRA